MQDRDYNNYKPYRTKAQKKVAKETAYKDKDGHWHSNSPVSYHPVKKELIRTKDRE